MDCGVVIVGAGRGERLGHSLRKAMVPLGGRPLLLRSTEPFARAPSVREIVLVVHEDDVAAFTVGDYAETTRNLGVTQIVTGGARRQDSVLAGVEALSDHLEGVMVHDAARPFVSPDVIERLAAALDSVAGALPVAPVVSTVKRVECGDDDADRVRETVPRDDLRLAQTPQAVRRHELLAALRFVDERGWTVTDDVQPLELAGYPVRIVEGSSLNFKITSPDDLTLAEVLDSSGLIFGETT